MAFMVIVVIIIIVVIMVIVVILVILMKFMKGLMLNKIRVATLEPNGCVFFFRFLFIYFREINIKANLENSENSKIISSQLSKVSKLSQSFSKYRRSLSLDVHRRIVLVVSIDQSSSLHLYNFDDAIDAVDSIAKFN
jgi:hypothetical protein